jgi:hypothetical protein
MAFRVWRRWYHWNSAEHAQATLHATELYRCTVSYLRVFKTGSLAFKIISNQLFASTMGHNDSAVETFVNFDTK